MVAVLKVTLTGPMIVLIITMCQTDLKVGSLETFAPQYVLVAIYWYKQKLQSRNIYEEQPRPKPQNYKRMGHEIP